MVRSNVPNEVLGVIPARLASTRFPRKALAILAGKPMIQHVWERALRANTLSHLVIATDDSSIFNAAQSFGAEVVMTREDHLSGTDRVAEVAHSRPQYSLIVNIQGDEPLIDPAAIDAAVEGLVHCDSQMGTLKKKIEIAAELDNPNVVKVVTDAAGNALYFSRSRIPFNRSGEEIDYYKHIGLYVYRSDFLLGYSNMPVGPLETAERLEQLRAMENGHRIHVVTTNYECLGVDTPEDLELVSKKLAVLLAGEI